MFSRAFTAILTNDSGTKAVDVYVKPGDEKMKNLLSEQYPDYELIALVPGQHARWSHLFEDESKNAQRKKMCANKLTKDVDVWDTGYLMEN